MTNGKIVSLFLLALLFACHNQSQNAATEGLNATEKIRFQQYLVQGQQLYAQHCSNCHQEDGEGLAQLIPPLAQSDYMLAAVDRTLCIIKYGLQRPIIVNGQDYQQMMPANLALRDIEVAQIATYIYNTWGNERGYIPVQRASAQLDQCER